VIILRFSFFKTNVVANLIIHFEYHMIRRILSREKEKETIDHLYFMSITIVKYIQDMKTQSFTSTFMFNMKKSFKSVIMKDTKEYVSHDGS
jgi:hypothetical protein